MDDTQMAHGHSFAYLCYRVLAAVQDRAVLDVRAATHDDRTEVRPQHRSVPDRGFVLDPDVADERGGRSDPGGRADAGLAAFECEQGHPAIIASVGDAR